MNLSEKIFYMGSFYGAESNILMGVLLGLLTWEIFVPRNFLSEKHCSYEEQKGLSRVDTDGHLTKQRVRSS
jgi:hypothetical protein